MLVIFAKLNRVYLSRWSDQFSSPDVQEQYLQEWMVGLAGLSSDQIALALAKCRTDSDWPPSIAKFRKFALGDNCKHIGPAYRVFRKALPRPVNRELGLSALAGIKAAL